MILLVGSFDLKKTAPYNLYCVGGDVKHYSINQSCQSTCLSVLSSFYSSCRNKLIFEHSVLLCEMSSVVLVTDSVSRPYNYVSNVVMKFTVSEISNDDICVAGRLFKL